LPQQFSPEEIALLQEGISLDILYYVLYFQIGVFVLSVALTVVSFLGIKPPKSPQPFRWSVNRMQYFGLLILILIFIVWVEFLLGRFAIATSPSTLSTSPFVLVPVWIFAGVLISVILSAVSLWRLRDIDLNVTNVPAVKVGVCMMLAWCLKGQIHFAGTSGFMPWAIGSISLAALSGFLLVILFKGRASRQAQN
jgi:hypothetical protein